MRSVNNKTTDLLLATNSVDYDILVFTETWLSPEQCDREFLDKKYKSFRKDRMNTDIGAKRGGGVLIALKNDIDCEEYSIPEMNNLEAVCVKINMTNGSLFVYCLYIQPSSSIEVYKQHLNAISKIEKSTNDILAVFGDWNMPDICWKMNDSGFDFIPIIGESKSERAVIAKYVTEFMNENDLFQICDLKNKCENTLDLIYINMPELAFVEGADMLIIPDNIQDKAHVQMVCTIECEPVSFGSCENSMPIYCFKKANFEAINECLNIIDFHELLSSNNIDEMVDAFYGKLFIIFDEHVPKATIRIDNKPIWFDKKLTNLKNIRNREYKKLCQSRVNDPHADETKFKKASDEFDIYHKQRHEEHVREVIENSKGDSKMFWKYINGKRSSHSLPNKMELDGIIASNDTEKCKLFATYFSSVYVDHNSDDRINELISTRNDHGNFRVIASQEAVYSVLKSLDTNKGMGPDMISPLVLKKCAEHLAEPLSLIFNKSLNDCVYPERFKIGHITPIFKSGSKKNVRNYRGVNVMPNLAKTFEKVLYNQLKLVIMPKLSKSQHGFLPNRNIETNLLEFTIQINNAFEKNSQIDTFNADITKAFDQVNQQLLVTKMARFPVSNSTLQWFNSYFKNRKQYAKVGSTLSDCIEVPSSVGQGTILGPLLFLIFFDDSDEQTNGSSVYNFADDKRIARRVDSLNDAENLQTSIDNFVNWCKLNGLELNSSKCKIITFTHRTKPILFDYSINDVKIDRVNQIRDLGIILDSKLDFKIHMETIKQKALSMLAFVRRTCRTNFNEEIAKLLYISLVRSNLEFGSIIWTPHTYEYRAKMESVQKQAVMFLNRDFINRAENNFILEEYGKRCAKFGIKSLLRRRLESSVLFLHKVITGRYSAPAIRNELTINWNTRTLRDPEFIRIKFFAKKYTQQSAFNMACRAYNHAVMLVDPTLPQAEFAKKLKEVPDSIFGDLCRM